MSSQRNAPRSILAPLFPNAESAAPPALLLSTFAIYALAHAVALLWGLALRPPPFSAPLLWPASGLLAGVLNLTDRRYWLGFTSSALIIECAMSLLIVRLPEPPTLSVTLVFAAAHVAEALVIATLMQRVSPRMLKPTVPLAVRRILGIALGVGVGTAIAAPMLVSVSNEAAPVSTVLSWFLADLCGAFSIGAIVVSLLSPVVLTDRRVRRNYLEMLIIVALGIVATFQVFSIDGDGPRGMMQYPFVLVLLFIWAGLRTSLPLIAVLCLASEATAVWIAASGAGVLSWSGQATINDLVQVQGFFAVALIGSLMLSTLNTERRLALNSALAATEQYRAFLQHGSEAIWRVDVRPPMPVSLSIEEQEGWLLEHAVIAEHNDVYLRTLAAPAERGVIDQPWRRHTPWVEAFISNLSTAAILGYRIEGIEIDLMKDSQSVWRASLVGHIEDGKLQRIWGVAQDITELKASESLVARREQRVQQLIDRLEARDAEARRAFAAELHDGPTQAVAAAAMMLEALRPDLSPDSNATYEQIRMALTEAQSSLRQLINEPRPIELSGREFPIALQRLAEQFRKNHRLDVSLVTIGEFRDVPEPHMTCLYRATRELLRNVVKHARATRCTISVLRRKEVMELRVRDYGVGLEREREALDTPGGFGLRSLHDSVIAIGGSFTLATHPSGGTLASVVLRLPEAREIERKAS